MSECIQYSSQLLCSLESIQNVTKSVVGNYDVYKAINLTAFHPTKKRFLFIIL